MEKSSRDRHQLFWAVLGISGLCEGHGLDLYHLEAALEYAGNMPMMPGETSTFDFFLALHGPLGLWAEQHPFELSSTKTSACTHW